jgi:omega-6 fatty acid desaturase (delta-12 desaturase)
MDSLNPRSFDDVDPLAHLRSGVAAYETPSLTASLFQIVSTVALFALAWLAMVWSLSVGYWLTLALAPLAAGLVVRIFIIQHDCGHGSMFRSRLMNDRVGRFCSLFTFAPYANWRRQHAGHHGNWNNLDRRESGADIYSACLTVDEYLALSAWDRFVYRAVRHPVVAHFLIPPVVFLLLYRVPFDTPPRWRRERRSVLVTNVALLLLYGGLSLIFGVRAVVMIQLPIMIVASIVGVWLFSLQHRFEGVLWTRQSEWTLVSAALEGSSFLKLPPVLQWFTGNIGFHHIHHLNPKVPNYRLSACHRANSGLHGVTTLSWRDGLAAVRLALWDETRQRVIRFSDLRAPA